MMRGLHQVRAVALTGFVDVAREAGLDPYAMLDEAGIDPGLLRDPETRLPASPVASLLEECAERSGCRTFVLGIAERRTFESLGALAPVLERLNSVRETLEVTMKQGRGLTDVFELHIHELGEPCFLEVRHLPHFAGKQAVMLTTAMTHVLLKGASKGRWKPRSVHLELTAPSDAERVTRFFGCPAEFGSAMNGFEVDCAMLDRPWDQPSEADDTSELIAGLEARIAALRLVAGEEATVAELEQAVAELRAALLAQTDRHPEKS